MNPKPTPDAILQQARALGLEIDPLGTPLATLASWSIRGVGVAAILSWYEESGFVYRAKFGRRWRIWARGKRLTTVAAAIQRDVDRERGRLTKYTEVEA